MAFIIRITQGQAMSEEKPASSINAIIKSITDITASVAAVMGYVQGIFKLVDTPYPNTISLATILFTSAAVVGARWGKIHEKKKNHEMKKNNKTGVKPPVPADTGLSKLNRTLILSLTRRRAEAGFIAAVTVFTVGWSGFISSVVTGLATDPDKHCSYAEVIYVANVQEIGEQKLLVADDLQLWLTTRRKP
jgi:hypothetical protein